MHGRDKLRSLSGGHPRDKRYAHYFVLGPDLDPDEVTRLTGVTPDLAWHAGDPKPRTGLPHLDGYRSVESGLTASDEFHDHLDALLERLRPAWTAFVELGRRHEPGVEVALYLHEAQGPLVKLLPDVAQALAELRATLGFDLYARPESEDDDRGVT